MNVDNAIAEASEYLAYAVLVCFAREFIPRVGQATGSDLGKGEFPWPVLK